MNNQLYSEQFITPSEIQYGQQEKGDLFDILTDRNNDNRYIYKDHQIRLDDTKYIKQKENEVKIEEQINKTEKKIYNFFIQQRFPLPIFIYNRDENQNIKYQSKNRQVLLLIESKSHPQYTVQNRETLDIDLQLSQEHSNSNAKKNGLKKYSNKDLLKYVAPIILLYIKGHTSNSKIEYCGNDKKRAQYYEQIIKISLSAEQCALVKQFQQKHRSTTIDQLKKLCGLKMLSEDLAEICDNSDNIRRLLLNQMRSPVFMKQMIKGKMSFNKKLSMIKKSSILERFPIEPQKISNFDQF